MNLSWRVLIAKLTAYLQFIRKTLNSCQKSTVWLTDRLQSIIQYHVRKRFDFSLHVLNRYFLGIYD